MDAKSLRFEISEDQYVSPADIAPRVLPAGWKRIPWENDDAGYVYENRSGGLIVLFTAIREDDGRRWVHVSVSRRSRVPDYDDLCDVKRIFIGADRKAIQIFPARVEHVNVHPNCLHLWACLDGDPLPDFRKHGML